MQTDKHVSGVDDLLFPFGGVQVAQSAVSDALELLICLLKLGTNNFIVRSLSLAHRVLVVGFVPVRVAANSIQPTMEIS